MTMWLGCGEIDKLTESEERRSKASRLTLKAETPQVPPGGATNVEVSATDGDGAPVADGTRIDMTASLGRIEPDDVRTRDGRALVAFRAGGSPGAAKVTAASGTAFAELTITVGATTPADSPAGATSPASFHLSQVTWLDTDVSGWAETSRVTSASIGDPPICIHHTKAGQWPVRDGAEGNPWIFVNMNGRWYGATFEWLSPGQECKYVTRDNVGAHIGRSPLSGWRPRSGELVGLMVSTLARSRAETIHERSNVVMVRWP
jgi:hypothetical protein